MTRPPLMSSVVSVILSTRPGIASAVQVTSGPICIRSVALARPAMMVKHSQTPRPLVLWCLELATGLCPRHEVVDDPDGIKADVFSRPGHGQDVGKVGASRRTQSPRRSVG